MWLLLPILILPALWPFISEGLPRSFDGQLHLLRIGVLDYHLRDGTLFPRWAPELMLGHGYPVFNFYAPLTYYLVEALHLLGLSYYTAFIVGMASLVLLAGYGMYFLASDVFGENHPWARLTAATAYAYAPYLLTNIYIRGAIAEAGAQAILPWLLWSARRLLHSRQPVRYFLPFVLTLGGLAVTHNITLLFAPPVLVGYLVLHWWQGQRSPVSLRWVGLGIFFAMGISAFFWLPLIGERRYLSSAAYEISREIWLPNAVWTWHNFLDRRLVFGHSFDRPVRLGLTQLGLAGAGCFLARRRDAEWLFFAGVALISGLLIGAWALPIWLGSSVLQVAQFPWRLLSVLSLPLALFAGGCLLRVPQDWRQTCAAALLITLVLVGNSPHLSWMDVFSPTDTEVTLPVAAQAEREKGAEEGGQGDSAVQEFRPRWADRSLMLDPAAIEATPDLTLTVETANSYELTMTVGSKAGGPLRFGDFYFPGWRVTVDEEGALSPYPSTNLGLLTVDVPAGTHQVRVSWTGTALQRGADAISLLALALLAWFCWRQRVWRWLALLPLALVMIGIIGTLWQRPVQSVQQVVTSAQMGGVRLLGYRLEQERPTHLYLYPYWHVTTSPSPTFHVRWQLVDVSGQVRADMTARPYFNTSLASNWSPGSLVRDAYQLPLPPGLSAGTYQLLFRGGDSQAELDKPLLLAGSIAVPEDIPLQAGPANSLDIRFDDTIRLAGFDQLRNGRQVPLAGERPVVVRPRDHLVYQLYWQALEPIDENYHGFIHLSDSLGQPLVGEDHLPGSGFKPPALWDLYYLQTDTYLLRIPAGATSGVYWPSVGLYDFRSMERLTTKDATTQISNDHFRLPPVKVIGPEPAPPEHRTAITFGDVVSLNGYSLQLPASGLQAGDVFTLTLSYQSRTPTPIDYTRFIHLHSPSAGMAAQNDGLPQGGNNPTWSWVPGEIVVDRVQLQVKADAPPGVYGLYTGLYDAAAGGQRLPAQDAHGDPIPDARVMLTEITIQSD